MSQMRLTSPGISANAPNTKTSTRPPLYPNPSLLLYDATNRQFDKSATSICWGLDGSHYLDDAPCTEASSMANSTGDLSPCKRCPAKSREPSSSSSQTPGRLGARRAPRRRRRRHRRREGGRALACSLRPLFGRDTKGGSGPCHVSQEQLRPERLRPVAAASSRR